MEVGFVVVTLDRIVVAEPFDVVAWEDVVVSKPVVDDIVVVIDTVVVADEIDDDTVDSDVVEDG